MRFPTLLTTVGLVITMACSGESPSTPRDIVGWRPLGTFSGRGNLQTETFTSDTGSFRVHWRLTAASADATLHVVFRSADSGNPIIDAVNQRGSGEGIASVSAERPRWYYLGVESTGGEWSVRIEEPLIGTARSDATRAR
jgi:hypothetical protein